MSPRERSILIVTCYGHFMSHFNMLVFPAVLLPLASKFTLSMTDTLALSFWMYLLFGISALPWGMAADRFGAKPLLVTFHIGAGICGILAAMVTDNPLLFSFALTGIGLFSGIYHPAGLGWIAKEFERTSRGLAYNGMFGNLGLAAAPLLAGIINYLFGVKAVYLTVGIINLFGLVFIYLTKKSNGTSLASHNKKRKNDQSFTPFLILLLAMMLGGIVYRGTSVTLPAYFEIKNAHLYSWLTELTGGIGSANVTATVLTSCIYLVGMVGQYTGGRVGESFDLRKGYLLFHAITIPAAMAMAMTTNWPLIFFAMVHSFFLLGMQPLENTLVARLTPPKMLSLAYGMKFILTFGVGALSVKMVEVVKVSFGLSAVFQTLGLVSTLLVMAILLLIRNTDPIRS